MRFAQRSLAILVAGTLPSLASAEGSDDAPSLEEMANKANNPLSDVWLMIVENDTSLLTGDEVPGYETLNSTLIEPVMPVAEFQYFAIQRDNAGPTVNFKFFLAPILLNPLK